MSTIAPARPSPPAHRGGSAFTGTTHLLRLYLRRDRIVLPLWVLLLSVPLAGVYIGSVAAIYPTAADRAGLAATIMASPAQRALYGQVYNDSLGAVGIWKAGMFHALIAIAVILTVVRHTRADEESGRAELVDSTAVGRYAGLSAALLLAAGGSIATGVIGAAGLLTTDVAAGGSLAFGAALACSGLVFTAVAAVTAQLSPSARVARTTAFAVLAVAFTLRAVGDAGDGGLSWLSPLGWALQVRPYAGDRWWVLLLPLTTAAALTVVAYRLRARRDVGAGLFAERPGPARASSRLRGAVGLAWRLGRGSLAVWTVGLAAYGLMIGSAVRGIGGQLGGDARDVVTRLGGTTALADAFIAVAFTMVGLVAAAFAISLVLRLHQEEDAGHAEVVLAAAVPRGRWLGSHLVMALGASALALLVAGAAAGIVRGGHRRPGRRSHHPRRGRRPPARGVAARGAGGGVVRARAAVHPGGLGGARRVRGDVSAGFAGRDSAVAGRRRTLRPRAAGDRRGFHRGAAAVVAGDRRGAVRGGRDRLRSARPAALNRKEPR